MDLLESLPRDRGATIVVVIHDPVVAGWADRVVQMLDGRVGDPGADAVSETGDHRR
jgi:putative ABC transport system ATP-binding protein